MNGFFGDLSSNSQNCPQIADGAVPDFLIAPVSPGRGPTGQAHATGAHDKAERLVKNHQTSQNQTLSSTMYLILSISNFIIIPRNGVKERNRQNLLKAYVSGTAQAALTPQPCA